MQDTASYLALQQNQSQNGPNNIDQYGPIFVVLLNHILHKSLSSEVQNYFDHYKDSILKLCSYHCLSRRTLLLQNSIQSSLDEVCKLFEIDEFYDLPESDHKLWLSEDEIKQIGEIVRSQVDNIQQLYNLNDDQSQQLQKFFTYKIKEFIELQIDEIQFHENHNPNIFQRFMILQLNYLNTFLDCLFNDFDIFTEYLKDNFQLLFVDLGNRIQIMKSIQYIDFNKILQNNQAIDTINNFDDENVF